MAQKHKIKNTLRNLPFYSEEMNNTEKMAKFPNTNFLSELPFFPKTTKQLSNYQLSKELPFFNKLNKRNFQN